MPSEAEINRALDDLTAYEEGMRFQALAVIVAKQHWPDLVACERKKDLGADAIANPTFCAEGGGKILACSITASIGKIRSDAKKIKDHFPGITKMIWAWLFWNDAQLTSNE